MKKVETELKNENIKKNQIIYEKNKNLTEEINSINKEIKYKSKKIEEIKSSKNYLIKYLNQKNISTKSEEEYKNRLELMKKYRNEYIRILKLIESNKRLINKNENEIIKKKYK